MDSVFTNHVRNFSSRDETTQEVLVELGELLRRRMGRRRLWEAPPSYLGYSGPVWDRGDAWDDLLTDCYLYAFLESGRLEALHNHLGVFPSIDGLIIRNVDHFLLERQRRHDPIGYAVYGNVEAAVRDARDMGLLRVEELDEGRRLQSDSLLHFPRKELGVSGTDTKWLRRAIQEAPGWDGALADLVRTTEAGQEWVFRLLDTLAASDPGPVRAGDLVALLADRARADWKARHMVSPDESGFEGEDAAGQLVPALFPDISLDDRDHWEWLKGEVARQIEALDRQARVRERLARVFEAVVEGVESGGSSPLRQADLARELGVPRATLADDFTQLREIVTRVRGGEKRG
jgi:hypothetical protein